MTIAIYHTPEKVNLETLFNSDATSDFLITYSKRVKRKGKLVNQEFTNQLKALLSIYLIVTIYSIKS